MSNGLYALLLWLVATPTIMGLTWLALFYLLVMIGELRRT